MKEVDLIQRYSVSQRGTSLAPGVYLGATAFTLTTQGFPILLNFVDSGIKCHDVTTGQGIVASGMLAISIDPARNNPALQSTNGVYNFVVNSDSRLTIPLYVDISASETLTFTMNFYCHTVTANNISIQFTTIAGYLCPKDYMNVGLIASNPG